MKNLVLITSILNPPRKPLTGFVENAACGIVYSRIRSIFTREQRFNQTKKTIQTIKEKIPESKIIIVECTNFNKEEAEYFKNNCDFVLNLWNKTEYSEDIFSLSKSLGEGTQTIQAIEYIKKQKFDNFFKISGRYWLNDDFNFSNFDNDKLVFKKIDDNVENILTCLFKIPYSYVPSLQQFLTNNIPLMKRALGHEILFGRFLKNLNYENTKFLDNIGIQGKIAINGVILKD